MDRPRDCKLTLGSAAPHLSQLAAGYTLLHRQGVLCAQFLGIHSFQAQGIYPHDRVLQAEFKNGVRLLYDLADGYDAMPDPVAYDAQLARFTRCFKRSYNPAYHNDFPSRAKLRPLGFNYYVTCDHTFFPPPPRPVPVVEDYISHNSYPAYRGLFITRLWEPGTGPGAEELLQANQFRVDCLRACKERLGERFVGGLAPGKTAKTQAPELVLPEALGSHAAFLRLLKENVVCVATEGPKRHQEWMVAECLAAGRALVCPEPFYQLPGEFRRGRNFAAYETPGDCAAMLAQVLDNVPWIHRMEAANFSYYTQYVSPAAMVRQTLQDI